MSQGIMERNLPVADSIGEGDKVRIVTSAGNSKNVDASQIWGAFLINETYNPNSQTYTMEKTWKEVHDAYLSGKPCITCEGSTYHSVIGIDEDGKYTVITNRGDYSTSSESGYPAYSDK